MEKWDFKVGETVLIVQKVREIESCKLSKVAVVKKTYVQLENGSKWQPDGSDRYPRSRGVRYDYTPSRCLHHEDSPKTQRFLHGQTLVQLRQFTEKAILSLRTEFTAEQCRQILKVLGVAVPHEFQDV